MNNNKWISWVWIIVMLTLFSFIIIFEALNPTLELDGLKYVMSLITLQLGIISAFLFNNNKKK